MSLEKIIREQMTNALKNSDKEAKQVYSGILNALLNKAKDLRVEELTDEQSNEVIVKMSKQLEESIATCPKDRVDILEKLQFEKNILMEYMPKQMTEAEIAEVIKQVLTEIGIDTPTNKDKGKIMKVLMPKVKGKVDGKVVNQVLASLMS